MVGFGVAFGGSDEGAEGVVEPVGVVEPPVAGTVEVAEGVAGDEPVPVIVVVAVDEVAPVGLFPAWRLRQAGEVLAERVLALDLLEALAVVGHLSCSVSTAGEVAASWAEPDAAGAGAAP